MDARFTPLHGKPVACGPRKGAPCPVHVGLLHTRSPDFTVKKLRACFRANKLLQERKGPQDTCPPCPQRGQHLGPLCREQGSPSVLRPRPVPGLRDPPTLLCLGGGPKCKPEQLLTKHSEQTRDPGARRLPVGEAPPARPPHLWFLITKGFAFQVLSQSRHF